MKIIKNYFLYFVSALILTTALFSVGDVAAQTEGKKSGRNLIDDSLWKAIMNEYSGEKAAKHILELSKFHRISGGSPGYQAAVKYVTQVMKSLGTYQVEVEQHLADGDRTYLKWRSMCGWDIKEAELWLENTGELLARFSDVPVSVFIYSNKADVVAEAVYVGQGTSDKDYQNHDVRGKIVLATGDGDSVHDEAVIKRGAAGVVVGPSGNDPYRSNYPRLVALHRLRSNKSLREKTKFGFSLSFLQFQKILQLLERGEKVKLRAFVDARLFDGTMETVSALLKGSVFPQKEIIFTAHLDHYSPGANDNASGSASLLEIARTLISLIDRGIIERPKRSIRFLWFGEMHGLAGYLSKDKEIGERGIAGLNLDMVGEDLYKTRSIMTLVRTPFSNPSFISDLVGRMVKYIDGIQIFTSTGSDQQFNYRISDYKGGSDHMMLSDPTVNVPCVCLGHDNDIFHHTDLDDLDKIDPAELKRVGVLSLASALFVANAEELEAVRLAAEVATQGVKRLSARTGTFMDDLYHLSQNPQESSQILKFFKESNIFIDILSQVEIKELESVKELSDSARVREFTKKMAEILKASAVSEKKKLNQYFNSLCEMKSIKTSPVELSAEEKELAGIVPRRLFRGPISQFYFEDIMGEGMSWYKEYSRKDNNWVDRRTEIINFMDGKRNLLDIYYTVSAEFGRSDLSFYKKFIADLKKHNLVDY
jgi:aminopeptidase YwaD